MLWRFAYQNYALIVIRALQAKAVHQCTIRFLLSLWLILINKEKSLHTWLFVSDTLCPN